MVLTACGGDPPLSRAEFTDRVNAECEALKEASDDFRTQARSVQQALERELPASVDAFRRAYVYLSHHGAATCTEADPHCTVCPVLKACPEGTRRIGSHG